MTNVVILDDVVLSKYDVDTRVKPLGKGAYGTIYEGTCKTTSAKVAIKYVRNAFCNFIDARRTATELLLLTEFSNNPSFCHTGLLHMKEVIFSGDSNDVYMVFDQKKTDLWHVVVKKRFQFPEKIVKSIMYQLFRALDRMHSVNIVHGDIKSSNILLDDVDVVGEKNGGNDGNGGNDVRLTVCDFNLSRVATKCTDEIETATIPSVVFGNMSDHVIDAASIMRLSKQKISMLAEVGWNDMIQTKEYRSPEMFLAPEQGCSTAVDMWSAGCVFGELLRTGPTFTPQKGETAQFKELVKFTGIPTAYDCKTMKLSSEVNTTLDHLRKSTKQIPMCTIFPNASYQALDLLCRLFAFNPHYRITAAEALKHPFLADNLENTSSSSSNSRISEVGDLLQKIKIDQGDKADQGGRGGQELEQEKKGLNDEERFGELYKKLLSCECAREVKAWIRIHLSRSIQ